MPPSFASGLDRLLTLLASGVPVGEADGYSPLVVLAAKGPLSQLQAHVEAQEPTWNATSSSLQITPLMASASAGQTEIIEFLIQQGAALDQTDGRGRTALYYAVIHNQVQAVQALLAHPVDLSITDNHGRNILHYAAWFTRVTITQALLRGNGEMENHLLPLLAHKDNFGCNPLHYAIIRKSESITELILSAQSEVEEDFLNEKDIMGRSPFFYACLQKDAEEFVEYLLDEGANVLSTETSQQCTALHSALLMQNAHVIRALLSSLMDAEEWDVLGALLEQRAAGGYTCLHLACLTGYTAFFQVLLSAYRKTRSDSQPIPLAHLVDDHGRTLLHMAAFARSAELCRLVAKHFPSLYHHCDDKKRTALFYAVKHIQAGSDKPLEHGQESCVAILVEEFHLDVHHMDMYGRTVLHYACHYNHLEQVRYLLSRPSQKSLDVCDHLGNTPLHVAATRGHAECVRLLILMGRARVDMQDAFGRTALHLAVQNKHSTCVEVLVQLGADVSLVDHKKRSSLHYACAIDLQQSAISEYCAQVVLQDSRKELVTCGDCRGLSPLLMACATGNIRILRELLHHLLRRASVGVSAEEPLSWPASFVDRRGWSPMHYAAFHGHGEVLRMLLEYFRSIPPLPVTQRTRMIEWTDRHGMSALHLASAYPSSSLGVKLLLDHGVLSPMKSDRYGRTALHLAAGCGNLSTCQIILGHGPSPASLLYAKDKEGRTPLDYIALGELPAESHIKLEEWMKAMMESHPRQKELEVHFEPLPELPLSMRPQAISLHDTQPASVPAPRSTPRKMRKKSISNITMRTRTPRPHHPVETRPVRTPPARISFDACASPERPTPTPATKRTNSAHQLRSQTPARNVAPVSRIPRSAPRTPQRKTKTTTPSTTKENQKPESGVSQRATPRRKRTPGTNQEPLQSRSSAATKKRYQYSLSSHQNVFERLNAHAVARQEARKARETAKA